MIQKKYCYSHYMDYSFVIAIISYVGALQLSSKFNARPIFSVIVAVVFPFVIGTLLKFIYVIGYALPVLENIFSLTMVLIFVTQFFAAFIVFYKLREQESIGNWVVWGTGGLLVIYLLIPFVINSIV